MAGEPMSDDGRDGVRCPERAKNGTGVRCQRLQGHQDLHFASVNIGRGRPWHVVEWGDLATMEPREGSEPEGRGFGRPYKVPVGTTFLAEGAFVRSVIDVRGRQGIVAVDLAGKWNHAARDTLAVMLRAEVAEELSGYLSTAAAAARSDWQEWVKVHGWAG